MANVFLSNGECSPQSIYQVLAAGTEPNAINGWHKIGTRAMTEDGRVFYYTKNATASALAAGKLYVRSDLVANHTECDVTAGDAGSYQVTGITLGATAMSLNQYADGYLVVTDGAGEGHTYRIKSHPSALSAATTQSVTLYDPIAVALDTNSTVSFIANAYDSPIIGATDQLDIPVGVPSKEIPVGSTTAQYGWVQTWGECGVLQDEAVSSIGQALTTGTGVAGAVEEDDTATTVSQEFLVGWTISNAVDTEYSPVFLTIRP